MLRDPNGLAIHPEHVAVLGGGRWARVITEELSQLLPARTALSVHSRRNAGGMKAWAQRLPRPIEISDDWPRFVSPQSAAGIVATATGEHAAAAMHVLRHRVPALVEKPIAMTAAGAHELKSVATECGTTVAAAHVFMFARYLHRFAGMTAAAGKLEALRLVWTDPRSDARYGEAKQYDAGMPIIADILPHVVSLLAAFGVAAPDHIEVSDLRRGGAAVQLELKSADVRMSVFMERESDRRRRSLTAVAGDRSLELDFAEGAGLVHDRGNTTTGDPDWDRRLHPLASMLAAFLAGAEDGVFDSRLDVAYGIAACETIDRTIPAYRAARACWLREQAASADALDADLRYALAETLHERGVAPRTSVDDRITKEWRQLAAAQP